MTAALTTNKEACQFIGAAFLKSLELSVKVMQKARV
jgi:hypothetical protein